MKMESTEKYANTQRLCEPLTTNTSKTMNETKVGLGVYVWSILSTRNLLLLCCASLLILNMTKLRGENEKKKSGNSIFSLKQLRLKNKRKGKKCGAQ